MNKKGISVQMTVMDLTVACIVVVGIFFGAVYMTSRPGVTNQKYLAKETALTLHAMYGTLKESEVQLSFPSGFKGLDVAAQGNRVVVVKSGKQPTDLSPQYAYASDATYFVLRETVPVESLMFSKNKDAVALHELPSMLRSGDFLDTKGDITTQTIVVLATPASQSLSGYLVQALRTEGAQVTTSGTGDLVIDLDAGSAAVLEVGYEGSGLAGRKSEKIGRLIASEGAILAQKNVQITISQVAEAGLGVRVVVKKPQQVSDKEVADIIIAAVNKYYGLGG
jgi:hypothetical protein